MSSPLSHIAWLLLAAALAAGCSRGPQVAIVAPNGKAQAVFTVEIADTPVTRERGLMNRRELGANAGMLFVFPIAVEASFWMKDTPLPLDMIFADSSGRIIGIIENAEPFSQSPREVPGRSQYVLEVNGGTSARLGIRAGQTLDFRGFTPKARD
ncbi:MAG: DUF192 domain-containing protein [Candidatus Binataceae bacterium]